MKHAFRRQFVEHERKRVVISACVTKQWSWDTMYYIEGECKIVREIGLVLNESVIRLYYECIRPQTWLCHACECKEIKIENDRYSHFDLIVENQQRAEISFEKFCDNRSFVVILRGDTSLCRHFCEGGDICL